MSAQAFTKAGLGIFGLSGTAYSAFELYKTSSPVADAFFAKHGLERTHHDLNLKIDEKLNSSEHDFIFESGKCFNTFFPGATVLHHEKKPLPEVVYNRENSFVKNLKLKPQEKPVGCSMFHFKFEEENKFGILSEIAVKGEDFGFALWTGLKKSSNNANDRRFQENIVFLQKSEEGAWSAVGGFSLYDQSWELPDNENAIFRNVRISIQGDLWKKENVWDPATKPHERKYVGIWEMDEYSNQEVIQDIDIYWITNYVIGKYAVTEILGRENKEKEVVFNDKKYLKNYESTDRFYKPGEGWRSYKRSPPKYGSIFSAADISEDLDDLYAPFKGKKGRWTEVEKYCDSRIGSRELSEIEFEILREFCYSRKGD